MYLKFFNGDKLTVGIIAAACEQPSIWGCMGMTGKNRNLVSGGILILLLALTEVAVGEIPTAIDMSVIKIARNDSHSSLQEVPAGSKFYYNISVANPDTAHDAADVVVTDKLPYNLIYDSAEAQASNGAVLTNATIHKTGDLLYVSFERIPKGETFYINITAYAPSEVPTTLYNIVNLRYANDPYPGNNTMTLATYVPVAGYNKSLAIESFEELLHNQTRLLFDFEDLLHITPRTPEENYTFITSFEQLLRAQANLSLSFEDLLENESITGWDDANISPGFQKKFIKSFNQIIWDEAFLFASFEMKLKDAWSSLYIYNTSPGHSQDAQTEFIASFESLLKDQVKLFDSYQLLLKTIDVTDTDVKVDGFAAFENLLRVQANLLMSFEDLLKMKYKGELEYVHGLSIDAQCVRIGLEGTAGKYTITLTNAGDEPIELNSLTSTYEFIDEGNDINPVYLLYPEEGENFSEGWTSVPPGDLGSGMSEYDTSLIGGPIAPGSSIVLTLALHVDTCPEHPLGQCYNTICATWDGGSICVTKVSEKVSMYPSPIPFDNSTNKSASRPIAWTWRD
jgi:hypothetical protein